jgi:8-amino-7-oxononanoate synthase
MASPTADVIDPLSRTRERGRGEGAPLVGGAEESDCAPSPAPAGHPLPQAGEGKKQSPLDARLAPQLDSLRERSLYRSRRTVSGHHAVQMLVDGKPCLNFCANDYLGLATDPRVAEAAKRAISNGGVGSTGSALISGYDAEHRAFEEEYADFIGRPRALLFSTGTAANMGVLKALLGRGDVVIADELNHASLIDGARASQAEYLRVPHADLAGYESALATLEPSRFAAVVTDGVFSMDGDIADLPSLARLTRAAGAALIVDDVHGLGVLGERGRGSIELLDTEPDVLINGLGKAFGCAGGIVAGSETLIEFLIQRARSWIFSTAPPPAIAAAARESLRILRAEPERRAKLLANVHRFIAGARERGLAIPERPVATPIQPVMIGDDARVMALSNELMRRGFWVAGIRPPTVPRGTARLRITLSAAHEFGQIDALLDALHDSLAVLAPA